MRDREASEWGVSLAAVTQIKGGYSVIYAILGFAFVILGIVLSNYELKRAKKQRCKALSQRVKRVFNR